MIKLATLLSENKTAVKKWYHYTSTETADAIQKNGFQISYRPENHYGDGIYFTDQSHISGKTPVFVLDGSGLIVFDSGKDCEDLENAIHDDGEACELIEDFQGYDRFSATEPGEDRAWKIMDKIAGALAIDAILIRDTYSVWKNILVVYNVDKLNELLRTKKIKRIE